MLCAATILLVTATRMLAVAICHLTGNRFRGVVYSYAAAIVYIPAYIILYNLFGADLSLLGIYLPMLVVEPAVIKRMESNDLETVGEAFRRGINNTIGICFSVLLVGVVRELLAEGTVWHRRWRSTRRQSGHRVYHHWPDCRRVDRHRRCLCAL